MIFRNPLYERIKLGGEFKIGPIEFGRLEVRVNNVQQQMGELEAKVSQLFLLTMSEPMYINLRKLASGNFGKYRMDDALKRELYHLRDIGYIRVTAIRAVPSRGNDLSSHIAVTDIGRRFIELRESVKGSVGEPSPSGRLDNLG
jgi:hypothetical protein